MSTLKRFSEKERDYHKCQSRQNFVREQRTISKELEGAVAERDGALAREAKALAQKDEALAEIALLKALLEQQSKSH